MTWLQSPTADAPARMERGLQTVPVSGTAADGSITRSVVVATFYFARVHGFAEWCETMEPEQALSFVGDVRRVLTDPVLKLGGEVAHRRPDSMLAVFGNQPDEAKPNHAQRALHAAILCVHESVALASTWLLTRCAGRAHLPALRLTVGVHLGTGELSRRRGEHKGRVFAIGEGVDIARRLAAVADESLWSVAATAGTHIAACGRAESSRSVRVHLTNGVPTEVVEITALLPRKGSNTPADFFEGLRFALAENSRKASCADRLARASH
jgi:serine/threonine-protein kinase PpkA